MNRFVETSVFLALVLSLTGYQFGVMLKKKLKWGICNPLLIAIVFVIVMLKALHIEYDSYAEGASVLSYLLTPATVCLAIPLYEQMELLKKNVTAVLLGILSGVLTSMAGVLVLAIAFGLEKEMYATLLPKSITTAIGMGVSEELGGIVTITVASIVITGVLGNVIAEWVCRIFRVHHPIAKGVAIGTASHAIGTAKAMELGEIEGAMSSLSIAVAGLMTVAGASIFLRLY